MDVIRLDFYDGDRVAAHQNPKRILFKVRFLKTHGDWALASVDPVNSDGKEIAEPRWSLLRRRSGQWSDAKYFDALRPFSSEESAQEALEMNPSTISKIQSVFPGVPKDIFPSQGN
ncbi:MAG: hypothetical protein JWO45_1206 [Spartobacteria bacterium]|nr:hypothetical protein [Spartobacteria bacterium]